MREFKIFSPLEIKVSAKRKFILNLNQYRNTHYRITNSAKIKYKEFIDEQLESLDMSFKQCAIIYTVFKGDKRRFDVGNICSIHQKFFEDALSERGIISDDKSEVIPLCIFASGGVDNIKPRVEIEVIDVGCKKDINSLGKKFRLIMEGVFYGKE